MNRPFHQTILLFFCFALVLCGNTGSIISVNDNRIGSDLCTIVCKNNGFCNPDNGKCVCPKNCEGEFCERCKSSLRYNTALLIILLLAGIVVFYYVIDHFRHRCMWNNTLIL